MRRAHDRLLHFPDRKLRVLSYMLFLLRSRASGPENRGIADESRRVMSMCGGNHQAIAGSTTKPWNSVAPTTTAAKCPNATNVPMSILPVS